MSKKPMILIIILLCLNIIILSCSVKEAGSSNLTLDQSIKEIIISKGKGYDFLSDEGYISHMDKLGYSLTINKSAKASHYTIGNLDEDNIPELAIFQERDPANIDDEGSLEIYKFDGDEYVAIDKVSMNYDNTNYQIIIGKISDDHNGILLNNQVGAHSGITYGFILKDGKLESILDEGKISLLSIYTSNEIKDINNDGILEFSIYIADPETEDSSSVGSDKMTLWYRWNGKDSADLIEVERIDRSKIKSDQNIFEEGKEIIENNFTNSLSFLHENKGQLSKFDNTELLMEYMKKLNEISVNESIQINDLFTKYQKDIKYQKDTEVDYLFNKYGLSMEKLNSLEYLKREKVLKDEGELKQDIIDHINLGYKLDTSEGMYYYLIDNQFFLDNFGENITNEYSDYLKVLALDSNKAFMNDGSLTIPMEELAERILLVESFKMIYPYSNLLPKVNDIYISYVYTYFYGDNHDPNFDQDTLIMEDKSLEKFEKTMEKYEHTNFANIVGDFIQWLSENNNLLNDDIREKLNQKLN